MTECSTEVTGLCDLEPSCPIKSNQRIISHAVRGALEKVMLADLAQPLQLVGIKDGEGKVIPVGLISGRTQ